MNRSRSSPNARRHHGGAILETALVLPLLLALTFGMIEFGYFFWVEHTLEGAALDGCRAAIISGSTNSQIRSQVNLQIVAAGLDPDNFSIQTTPANIAAASAGTNVTVSVDSTWGQAGLNLLGLIPSDKKLAGTCIMRHE